MSTGAIEFLLGTLFWLAVMAVVYAAVLFGADALLTAAHQRRQHRQHVNEQLARIDREADASVRRMATAFELARHEIQRAAAQEVRRP